MIITHNGVDFEVECHAYAGFHGNRDEPPEPPEFWLTSIKVDGKEFYEMLTDETVDVLEKLAIEMLAKAQWESEEYYHVGHYEY